MVARSGVKRGIRTMLRYRTMAPKLLIKKPIRIITEIENTSKL